MFPTYFQAFAQILWACDLLLALEFIVLGVFLRGRPLFKILGRDLALLSAVTALTIWFQQEGTPYVQCGLFLFLCAALHTAFTSGLDPAWSRGPRRRLLVLGFFWALIALAWRIRPAHSMDNLMGAEAVLFGGLAGFGFTRARAASESMATQFRKVLPWIYLFPCFSSVTACFAMSSHPTLAWAIWLGGLLSMGTLALPFFADHLAGLFTEQEKLLLQTTLAHQALEQEKPLQELGRHTAEVSRDIRGFTTQLQRLGQRLRFDQGGRPDPGLERIERARQNLERYAQGILDYAASFNVQLHPPQDLIHWLRQSMGEICFRYALQFHFHPPEGEMRVRIDPVFLRKSLHQICLNAKEAEASSLTVRVQQSGSRAEVLIEDDGMGCDPEAVDQFKFPFYTTKKSSGACGLGLAMAETIVQGHGGLLNVSAHGESPGERGFWVVILLPLAPQ